MNNDAETETQSTEFQGPELRDLLLESYSVERILAHPRQEAHRHQQNAIDAAKKAKKDHDDAQKTGYAPWTPTIWYSSGLRHPTTEDPSQAVYEQPPMDPKIFEFKLKHEKPRFQGLELGLQFPITDAHANRYWVPVQSSEAP
ncbi:unnamed protein product [Aureobasidium pullulans]|nr:unnamed protein product [Aureobasidium pullulans]